MTAETLECDRCKTPFEGWVQQQCDRRIEYSWWLRSCDSGPFETELGNGMDENCSWVCPFCKEDLGPEMQNTIDRLVYGTEGE